MAKLSRTARYQELRDQLDEETTAAQTSHSEQIKLTRSSKGQAMHGNKGETSLNLKEEEPRSSTVMDELLGEVKQYNIDNGARADQDTQINILKTLDSAPTASSRRSAHMETMETNEDAGGTTMNVMAQNLDILFKPEHSHAEPELESEPASRPEEKKAAPKAAPERDEISILKTSAPKKKADEEPVIEVSEEVIISSDDLPELVEEDDDQLEMFDLGVDDFDRTIRQPGNEPVKYASRREMKKAKKKEKASAAKSRKQTEYLSDTYSQPTERIDLSEVEEPKPVEESSSGSKFGNILLIVLIVILVAAICYTLYLISQAGIF